MQNKTTEIATIRQAVRLQEWSELIKTQKANLLTMMSLGLVLWFITIFLSISNANHGISGLVAIVGPTSFNSRENIITKQLSSPLRGGKHTVHGCHLNDRNNNQHELLVLTFISLNFGLLKPHSIYLQVFLLRLQEY